MFYPTPALLEDGFGAAPSHGGHEIAWSGKSDCDAAGQLQRLARPVTRVRLDVDANWGERGSSCREAMGVRDAHVIGAACERAPAIFG
ncbi:hypothetical protein [Arachnia rubra]|uniref:hypothetical protein n=1 Tax=Arachnia rubra TaxID=1547448 RepID=UPI001FD18864|nr:hypothetical protein [Arachnia rubra]